MLTYSRQIVDDSSGVMGVADERIVPMPGCDHRSVCRFAGESSGGYKSIIGVLPDWVEDLGPG